MATSEESKNPISSNPTVKEKGGEEELQNGEEDEEEETEEEEEEEEEEDEDEENESKRGEEERLISERTKLNNLVRRLSSERVFLRVHDIVIKGNTKTKDFLIEAEFDALKSATSMRELIQAAAVANARLQHLDIFDSVSVTLDAGPPELPGTTNVIVEVVETHNPLTGDIGVFSKPEVKSSPPPPFLGFACLHLGAVDDLVLFLMEEHHLGVMWFLISASEWMNHLYLTTVFKMRVIWGHSQCTLGDKS